MRGREGIVSYRDFVGVASNTCTFILIPLLHLALAPSTEYFPCNQIRSSINLRSRNVDCRKMFSKGSPPLLCEKCENSRRFQGPSRTLNSHFQGPKKGQMDLHDVWKGKTSKNMRKTTKTTCNATKIAKIAKTMCTTSKTAGM